MILVKISIADPDPTLKPDQVNNGRMSVCIIGLQEDFSSLVKLFFGNMFVINYEIDQF